MWSQNNAASNVSVQNNGEQRLKAFTRSTGNRDLFPRCTLAGYHVNC